jgi:hypothetical protein
MKFKVLSAVKFNGRVYAEGETIEATEKDAPALPAHCVEEVKATKAKKVDKTEADEAGAGEQPEA